MVSCKTVIAQLSNYLDGEANAEMRRKIENHLGGCRHCSAVYDSSRKMLVIMGDGELFELPEGYGNRLHNFVDAIITNPGEVNPLP